jgi:preprotein translocase subunit SecA
MLKWLGNLVDSNEKEIKRLQPLVDEINKLEPDFQKLDNDGLKGKTAEFKARLVEATSEINRAVAEAQKELEETKLCLPDILEEDDRKDKENRCKQLEENIAQFQKELHDVEEDALYELLPEAFAAVREAARRTIGQRHFDVQLLGGIVLHQGKIAEMKTGEGKTLVATLPLYLNSLTGKGCHLVTVNDYLARIGPHWMGPIYTALGVTVASIYPQQTPDDNTPSRIFDPAFDSGDKHWPHFRPISRKEAYQADIIYGTSSDFGFDYLRDNMIVDLTNCVQRSLNYAIVDEVDNLLIDEARTPLIISGPAEDKGRDYQTIEDAVRRMTMKELLHEPVTPEEKDEAAALEEQFDYISYAKERHVRETARGQEKMARALGKKTEELFGSEGSEGLGQLTLDDVNKIAIFRQAMIAHALYQKDRDYVIDNDTDGQPGIIIIDEFTGRRMLGRRFSEGLHQAIEAKEHLNVRRESMTYATVTIQNYFRMYAKLAGMTGTASTEAEEFHKIYKLEVVEIPTNKPMIRQDFSDRIYKDETAKFKALINEVADLHKKQQPVLIGTVSIEKSEIVSELMKRRGIPHRVLNAKEHLREADIVREAGRLGAVTVATNMAGRGVDIILGGNTEGRDPKEWQKEHDKVIELGGLFVLGTERHEARRIDNQLRGRSGRQGDPGQSRFYVSIDDDIMKRFGGDRLHWIMDKVGMDEDTPIENKLVNRTIEGAQVRVEGYHFDTRKQLVEFDDVVNQQRKDIYNYRKNMLSGANLKEQILERVREALNNLVSEHTRSQNHEEWDLKGLLIEISTIMPLPPDVNPESLASLRPEDIEEKLAALASELYDRREQEMGSENMRMIERLILLRTIDTLWIAHLTEMDRQRLQASWAGLKQVKAVNEYKMLGNEQWDILTDNIRQSIAHTIFHVGLVKQEPRKVVPETPMAKVVAVGRNSPGNQSQQTQKVAGKKVGRNDPCPCGSGKKYKHCHGK